MGMRASIEDWNNGWVEVEVSLTLQDIDRLIALLKMIKADPDQHFHATSDFVGEGGVGKMTFDVQAHEQDSNLSLGRGALGVGALI